MVTTVPGKGLCEILVSAVDGKVHVRASCNGMIMLEGNTSLTYGYLSRIEAVGNRSGGGSTAKRRSISPRRRAASTMLCKFAFTSC